MKTLIIWFTIFISAASAFSRADEDPLLLEAIELILNENFPQSEIVIDKLIKKYPTDPVPLFFKGVLYWRQGSYLANRQKYEAISLGYWEQSIELCDELLINNENDVYALFFKGGAYGLIGTIHTKDEKYLKAGIDAYKGIRNLEKSFELNRRYWDIYYGMGLYHITAANAPMIIKFLQRILPIPEGNEDLGILYLKTSLEKGRFTPFLSRALLSFCYTYHRSNYDSAFSYINPLIEKYPRNTACLILTINICCHQGFSTGETDWYRLIELISVLDNRLVQRNESLKSWYQEKFLFFKGYALFKLSRYDESQSYLDQFLSTYPQHPLSGIAHVAFGAICDINKDRDNALIAYQQASDCEQFGNLMQLIIHYSATPYTKSDDMFFVGDFFSLPDRP